MSAEDEIRELMRAWYHRASPWVYDQGTNSFNPHPVPPPPVPLSSGLTFIGTDEREFSLSLDAVRSVTNQQDAESLLRFVFLPGDLHIRRNGDTAWVADLATLVRDRRPRVVLRVTAVLTREGGVWTLQQVHLSAGVRNEELFGSRMASTVEDLADRAARDAARTTADDVSRFMTIVFTDIESSTDHLVRIGDKRWLEVVNWHNWKVREVVIAHGGHEVSTQGDGFMLAFGDVAPALDCLLDLLAAFAVTDDVWDPAHLRVRMGAHAGPVTRDYGDYRGETVVKAARISASAAGGQALVSAEVAQLAPQFKYGTARELALKGLKGQHGVVPLLGRRG